MEYIFGAFLFVITCLSIYVAFWIERTSRKMHEIEGKYRKSNIPLTGSFVRHGMTFSEDGNNVIVEHQKSEAYYARLFKQAVR